MVAPGGGAAGYSPRKKDFLTFSAKLGHALAGNKALSFSLERNRMIVRAFHWMKKNLTHRKDGNNVAWHDLLDVGNTSDGCICRGFHGLALSTPS